MRKLLVSLALSMVASLLGSGPALGAPLAFFFDSGSARITVTRSSDGSLVIDEDILLDGAFVTFDPATPALVDFDIRAGSTGPFAMLQSYAGFDTFTIESLSITPGASYANTFFSMTGPTTYSFLVGPVDVGITYSAFNSGGPPPAPVSNSPLPTVGDSFLNGTLDTDTMALELLGITLAEIPGGAFGESDNLILKADITWSGVVPEPGTASLLGVGLVLLSARRRRGVH